MWGTQASWATTGLLVSWVVRSPVEGEAITWKCQPELAMIIDPRKVSCYVSEIFWRRQHLLSEYFKFKVKILSILCIPSYDWWLAESPLWNMMYCDKEESLSWNLFQLSNSVNCIFWPIPFMSQESWHVATSRTDKHSPHCRLWGGRLPALWR